MCEVGLIDGQLLANGASWELIHAVERGNDQEIATLLSLVSDQEERERLTRIIERLRIVLENRSR